MSTYQDTLVLMQTPESQVIRGSGVPRFDSVPSRAAQPVFKKPPNSLEGEKTLNQALLNRDTNALKAIKNRYPRGTTPHAVQAFAVGLDLNNPAADLPEQPSGFLLLASIHANNGNFADAQKAANEYKSLSARGVVDNSDFGHQVEAHAMPTIKAMARSSLSAARDVANTLTATDLTQSLGKSVNQSNDFGL